MTHSMTSLTQSPETLIQSQARALIPAPRQRPTHSPSPSPSPSLTLDTSHQVYRSPIRYAAMRRESGGRSEPVVPSGTDEVVGPGKYDPAIPTEVGRKPAFSIDGTAAFASRELRVPPQSFQLPHRTAEPGYSSVALDRSAWNRKGSGHPKGEAWAKGQRFRRPPGPGSNLPESKPPPGPGSYQKLHSWPQSGYTGTAKGFNHKGR